MEVQRHMIENLKLFNLAMRALFKLKEIQDYLNKKKKRSCSVRLANRDRKRNGFYNVTFLKMKETNIEQFFSHTRMSPEQYDFLLLILKPMMVKISIREPISPDCRLALILLYLSQATPIASLALSFKLGKETVRSIILETAEIIWQTLMPMYLSEPTADEYKQISSDFLTIWKMPNCVGAIGGKHIAIRCASNSAGQSFNHKKRSSIVLLATCDSKYQFTHVDVGAHGNLRDEGIIHASSFAKRLLGNTLPIPRPNSLPNSRTRIPNYFVGDASFPLAPNLMRPYPGVQLPPEKENFNKRLSKARSTIENSFGILISRWRILSTTLHMNPQNAEKIVLACLTLHNFLMIHTDPTCSTYCPHTYVDWEDSDGQHHDGLWRSEVQNMIRSLSPTTNIHHYGGTSSTTIRNILCEYFKKN